MHRFFFALLLCILFFLFPFQIYIIGEEVGIGIQGALYRIQASAYGDSLILITNDIGYVTNQTYSGKTALAIIIWVMGTFIFTLTTIFGLGYASESRDDYYQQISKGILACCACYLLSDITQFGIMFSGSAGIAMPFGILLIIFWTLVLNRYPNLLSSFIYS